MTYFLEHYNYWIVTILLMTGLYIVIARPNLFKKMIGLSIFQTAIFILYISVGKVKNGSAPILADNIQNYSNPLPHVLILTAIVVGVATLAVGLALIVRIHSAYDTVEDDEIQASDLAMTNKDKQ